MDFGWLKRYFPRSLFGRSLLILLFPVIGLQLIVGQVFIQRHFQQVTEQMAESVGLEINYAIQLIELAVDNSAAQEALDEISVNLKLLLLFDSSETMPNENSRYFYDLSGKALILSLSNEIMLPLRFDLKSDQQRVAIWVQTPRGVLEVILPRSRVSATNPHQLLVLMIFASIILVIISVGFLRIQIRPIGRLAQAAEAFGKGQIIPMHPSGSTDIRRAALAFLTMRNKLDRQIEQRTQMLSSVSHDLRTPLTRLKLALEMTDNTEEMRKDVAEMERMLNGFLAFSRDDKIEEGESVDPANLARDLIEILRRGGAEIELVLEYQTTNRTDVFLKPDAVRRALQNLLDNAGKYGNSARLTVVLSDKFLEFRVEDFGEGIAKDLREKALQPFSRLDDSRGSDGSVGLGLSIATDIARAHGGNLELTDSVELGGLCVRLIIPR